MRPGAYLVEVVVERREEPPRTQGRDRSGSCGDEQHQQVHGPRACSGCGVQNAFEL
ncbi:hypothetical protein [Dactylosporangium sp. CA-233914]|uniref:hypothetical protein n=1 Tax=Dactylosporangium sp. CA-233914 TaxID=3239934 RepID=UPI003D8A78D0